MVHDYAGTGSTIPGFTPTCLHRSTGELAAVADGVMLRRPDVPRPFTR